MKVYYFSSILLLTLFYMVNGQNVSGVKTIPTKSVKTIPDTISVNTIIGKTITTNKPYLPSTTTTKKTCPTANKSEIETRCQQKGGRLILDECGFYSVCLISCNGDNSTTKTLPGSPKVLKDPFLNRRYFNGYVYCSCIFADILSIDYSPSTFTQNTDVCQRILEASVPNEPAKVVVDPIPITTTTIITTTTNVITTQPKPTTCPTKVLNNVGELCERNGGILVTEGCESPICIIPCGNYSNLNKRDSTTKTIPPYKFNNQNGPNASKVPLERIIAIHESSLTTPTKTFPSTTKTVPSVHSLEQKLNDTTTTRIPKTTRNGKIPVESIISSPSPKIITTTTRTQSGKIPVESILSSSSPKIITTTTRTQSGKIPWESILSSSSPKRITTTTTTTRTRSGKIPVESIISSSSPKRITTTSTSVATSTKIPPVINNYDFRHGDFNGIIYCSCIYINGYSSGYADGIISSDISECQGRLPKGNNYTLSGKMVAYLTHTTSIPTSTSTKCIQTVTITKKEKETITLKETITVTVDEEPTPVQCAEKRAQCGGKNYSGPTCCPEGYICRPFTSYYSECVEKGKEY